jgi:Mn-dependent DtxR family transcriptional regulator
MEQQMSRYTPKQGQYLTYIYFYTKIHGRSPAESEIEAFFDVSPASEHQMIVKLTEKGLITRVPYSARSIKLNLTRQELQELLANLFLEGSVSGRS